MSHFLMTWIALFSIGVMEQQPPTVDQVLAELTKRAETIGTLTCRYSLNTAPTEEFVSKSELGEGRTRETIRVDLTNRFRGNLLWDKDGQIYAESTLVDAEGKPDRSRILAYDGKTVTFLTAPYKNGELISWTVELNCPKDQMLQDSNLIVNILGLPCRDAPKDRFTEIRNSTEKSTYYDIIKDGTKTVVLQWNEQISSDIQLQHRAWFDPNKGYSLVQMDRHLKRPPRNEWIKVNEIFVKSMQQLNSRSRSDDARNVWLPENVDIISWNPLGYHDFSQQLNFESHEIGLKHKPHAFSPAIEEGSNVSDRVSGKSWVYGSRPSARIREALDRRISESKELLGDDPISTESIGHADPPRTWLDVSSWIAFALATIILLIVLLLVTRR